MALKLENLDERTRKLMQDELKMDLDNNRVYFSKRLNQFGKSKYVEIVNRVMAQGTDTEFAEELGAGCLNETELRSKQSGGFTVVKVPKNANEMLAEGEYNRYYIRALCRRVIEDGNGVLEIYRAKHVNNPRPESEAKIGALVDPNKLLDDLRNNIGVDTALGIPAGPNSGLSVRIKTSQTA